MNSSLSNKAIMVSNEPGMAPVYCDASKHPGGKSAGLAQQQAFMLTFRPGIRVYLPGIEEPLSFLLHPENFDKMLRVIRHKREYADRMPVSLVTNGWSFVLIDI